MSKKLEPVAIGSSTPAVKPEITSKEVTGRDITLKLHHRGREVTLKLRNADTEAELRKVFSDDLVKVILGQRKVPDQDRTIVLDRIKAQYAKSRHEWSLRAGKSALGAPHGQQ